MVSVCLLSDALSQHLLSYLGFSYLGHGVSLHGCSSKAQPLLLTMDEGYLLTATPPDLGHGVPPLGPPAPAQPALLGRVCSYVKISRMFFFPEQILLLKTLILERPSLLIFRATSILGKHDVSAVILVNVPPCSFCDL